MIPLRNIGWLLVILPLLVATTAFADPNQSVLPTENAESIGSTTNQVTSIDSLPLASNQLPGFSEMVLPSMTRIGFSLLLIVGFIYVVVFLMRKFTGSKLGTAGKGKAIQVIEQTYLAPKKSICLIKLGERAVLVGITEANVNMLTEFNWDELPELDRKKVTDPGKQFSGFLSDAAGKLFGAGKRERVSHEQG